MVVYCSAYGCKSKYVKGGGITFHCFPKDEELRKLWEKEVRREGFKATQYSRLCSNHFNPDCFDTAKFGGTWLKKNALPTIFNFPPHLQKTRVTRKLPKSRCEASATPNEELDSAVNTAKGKKRKYYLGDFTENDLASPTKAKQVLTIANKNVAGYRKKIKTLNQKTKRMKKKITSMKEIFNELKTKSLIVDSSCKVLELSLPESAVHLLRRVKGGKSKEKYPPQLRSFALTLNFYSAKAYNYVRKTFNSCLPHPSVIRKWYQGVDGSPGFTEEAFNALSVKAKEAKEKGKVAVCGLMIDEMSIRSNIEWDKTHFSGFVDLGTSIDDDQLPHAKEALTFMVNSLNGNWKVPIAYFLINGLNCTERANLIKEALLRLHDTGIKVVSLTCDGLSANIATVNNLGANISAENLKVTFPHPKTNEDICIMLDVSHMIKLVRNTLASKGSMFDGSGGMINWAYIEHLTNLQEKCGLHAANKLRRRHVQWYREKMKVKLATQTLSLSVANSLEYLCHDRKIKEFEGVSPTVKFIKIFNNLFDILNSKNLLSDGFKAPLKQTNETLFFSFLNEADSYIRGLKISANGDPILLSNRKMGFLGLLTCINSIKILYNNLCKGPNPIMNFLLTYKLSQDHLEMFFSAVRSKGGYNNNPTAKQFKAAYVRLLCHHQIMTSDNANCITLDDTQILNISSAKNNYVDYINHIYEEEKESDEYSVKKGDAEDTYFSEGNIQNLNYYVSDVVGYISGFIVKKLTKKINCEECVSVLQNNSNEQERNFLIQRKDRGGLVNPASDVVKICKLGERNFRVAQVNKKLKKKNAMHKLIIETLQEVSSEVFQTLNKHTFSQSVLDNHKISLIKAILFEFFKIRFYHLGKQMTEKFQLNKVRSINNKTTLFAGH